MRVLLFGDRDWSNKESIIRELRKLSPTLSDVLIHGAAKGADTFGCQAYDIDFRITYARGAALCVGFGEVISFPANWDKYHRAAGPIRNQEMLAVGKPDRAVGFHQDIESSKGTKDMARRLEKAGVPFEIFTE